MRPTSPRPAADRDRPRAQGRLLFFAFRPGLTASHEAIVTGRPGAGYADTVEGNVAHAVRVKRRGLRYAVAAARVVMR